MSNSKWRKLFTVLADFPIYRLAWRFVDSDAPLITHYAPSVSDLLDDGIRDGRFCPFDFRVIESISIPATVEIDDRFGSLTRTHELIAIEAAITRIGQFCITRDDATLTIHGYT